jgi:mono/diheme cytochrome c family protein
MVVRDDHAEAQVKPATVRATVVAAVVVLFVVASYAADVRQPDSTWVAPPNAASKRNPLASRPELAAGGARIFAERCAMCHGDTGRGTPDAPSLVTDDVLNQTDGSLFWKISSGNTRAGMPTFSFLPEGQRWQLVLHVRNLGRVGR